MAKRTTRAIVYTCDNPSCRSNLTQLPSDDEPPEGYHLKQVTIIYATGGSGAKDVFACQEDCVLPAIEAACFS